MIARYHLIMLVLVLSNATIYAQHTTCDSVYRFVDEMPKFGSHEADFTRMVSKRIKVGMPCEAKELQTLEFIVNKNGKMTDIHIPGANSECLTNLIRLFESFPSWSPGKLHGEVVCVKMILLVRIHVND